MELTGKSIKPKLSVIVPVYNAENFVQDCIDSLVNQTLNEIEIIFVNDASTDHSLDILKRNQILYPDKIRIIDSKENLRQGGARNLGICEAQGDYIAFVDSDDFVTPTAFEQMYMRIVEREADVCYMDYAQITENTSYYLSKKKNFAGFKGNGWIEKQKEIDSVVMSEEEIMAKANLTILSEEGYGEVYGRIK